MSVAAISLLLYTVLTLVTLNAFDITLTLPGIAGIILGIGMAVDANVIIYARIREEIAAGKSVKSAIDIGFQKSTVCNPGRKYHNLDRSDSCWVSWEPVP